MKPAFCPGSANLRTPIITVKACPQCQRDVEVFSNEVKAECRCGFTVYNDIESCVQWCKYARECVGDALYEELTKGKDQISHRGTEGTEKTK
jgi:hypothetical protein